MARQPEYSISRFNVNTWAANNLKFPRFCHLLQMDEMRAFGLLVRFWNFVAANRAMTGSIADVAAWEIGRFCWWRPEHEGPPELLVKALKEAGYVSDGENYPEEPDGTVHDWFENQPLVKDVLQKREARKNVSQVNTVSPKGGRKGDEKPPTTELARDFAFGGDSVSHRPPNDNDKVREEKNGAERRAVVVPSGPQSPRRNRDDPIPAATAVNEALAPLHKRQTTPGLTPTSPRRAQALSAVADGILDDLLPYMGLKANTVDGLWVSSVFQKAEGIYGSPVLWRIFGEFKEAVKAGPVRKMFPYFREKCKREIPDACPDESGAPRA